jgi:NADH-quinone oxidoreductase subunit H
MERRFIAQTQRRMGPNRVGPMGLSQPFADMLKLVQKETVLPRRINRFLFFFRSFINFRNGFIIMIFCSIFIQGSLF